jgi:flagellar biosynthesis/type III secretory pathway M-ring protein FliF/YscJ
MFAMRPARSHRQSCPPAERPGDSAAPTDVAAQLAGCGADASSEFATQIAQARRDARRNPAQAAMLLRAWMSDHG